MKDTRKTVMEFAAEFLPIADTDVEFEFEYDYGQNELFRVYNGSDKVYQFESKIINIDSKYKSYVIKRVYPYYDCISEETTIYVECVEPVETIDVRCHDNIISLDGIVAATFDANETGRRAMQMLMQAYKSDNKYTVLED